MTVVGPGIDRYGQEPDDQALAGADTLDSVLGLVGDLDHVVTGEVGQLDGLEVGSEDAAWPVR